MARFFGSVQGSRGEVTRLGGPSTGIVTRAQGWRVGVRVVGEPTTPGSDQDVFHVYATSGSGGYGSSEYVGRVLLGDDGRPTFEPVEEISRASR